MTETIPAEITNPAPGQLASVTVATDSGNVQLICEPINEWLAITPEFFMDTDAKTVLTGAFTITHVQTGLEFTTGAGCIVCCRNCGKALDALGLDWQALAADTSPNHEAWVATLTDEQKRGIVLNRDLAWLCDADYCDEIPDDAAEAGD